MKEEENNLKVVSQTNLQLKVFKKGKVRDIYQIDNNLLIVVSDRISAFDYVLLNPIPFKGIYLNQITRFWFDFFKDTINNHMISTDFAEYPDILKQYKQVIDGRSMLSKKADVFPIECIVRGYLSGSAWESYQKNRTVCNIELPGGMRESEKLDNPIFTPSTKAIQGHDINISFEKMKQLIGREDAQKIKELSLKIYIMGAKYALNKGIIIADTKFEFGKINDEIILVDEVLTPDSSRFWPLAEYKLGRSQQSFDKQYVRDYLISTNWDKNSTPPSLPKEVITETQKKYNEAFQYLTGEKLNFNKFEDF
jgi:phosphoribosylaminoimidazole-succinocarboxamide synthase